MDLKPGRLLLAGLLGIALLSLSPHAATAPAGPTAQTYYVSSSSGDDDNDGLSEGSPFASVGKVNSLALQPGDSILFKCGDVWRADPLLLTQSGTADSPITFGSYPAECTEQPVLSGARAIAGWVPYRGHIYVADLSAGDNAGNFPHGVNQLFRDGGRLPLGRWPNLDAGDGGYSTIDGQLAGDRLSDDELPAGDWGGAVAHIRGMRWYILNRQITGSSGQSLTVGSDLDCWGGDCTGWGYFLHNHLDTLDREGEWCYDAGSHRVYLYSEAGLPTAGEIEGSVVLRDDDRAWGGIVLGEDLGDAVHYVVVENLELRRWYNNGVSTPTNLHSYENSNLVLRDLAIRDVDGSGIHLGTWVYDAHDGADGWRGGNHITISGCLIERANHRGIDTYAKQSTISDNVIRDVARIENLGVSGMGCGPSAGGGFCTEDGDGIRIKVDEAADSGHHNTIRRNVLERIAYNGIDVFGHNNTLERNVIRAACYAKGDCGGVRTFGSGDLSTTPVHDLRLEQNLVLNTIGNTDGCKDAYDALFGFGLYIDHYSRDVTLVGNSIISSTASGILYQNATGSVSDNVLYNNSRGTMYAAQVSLGSAPAYLSSHSGNVLYGLRDNAGTLSTAGGERLGSSDQNAFFNPYQAPHISAEGAKTLAEWQAYSGQDTHSQEAWFSLAPGEPSRSRLFYNDTAQVREFDLGDTLYLDLEQNPVTSPLTLPPFSSQVLIVSKGEYLLDKNGDLLYSISVRYRR